MNTIGVSTRFTYADLLDISAVQTDDLAERRVDIGFAIYELNGNVILPAAAHHGNHIAHEVLVKLKL